MNLKIFRLSDNVFDHVFSTSTEIREFYRRTEPVNINAQPSVGGCFKRSIGLNYSAQYRNVRCDAMPDEMRYLMQNLVSLIDRLLLPNLPRFYRARAPDG